MERARHPKPLRSCSLADYVDDVESVVKSLPIRPVLIGHSMGGFALQKYLQSGLLAAIHATAALGSADCMIEWRLFDLEATIYGDALSPREGRISVPRGPGLGIDPDPDVISAYRT